MTESSRVRVEIADHVAVVALSRPGTHDALDIAMFEQIVAGGARRRSAAQRSCPRHARPDRLPQPAGAVAAGFTHQSPDFVDP